MCCLSHRVLDLILSGLNRIPRWKCIKLLNWQDTNLKCPPPSSWQLEAMYVRVTVHHYMTRLVHPGWFSVSSECVHRWNITRVNITVFSIHHIHDSSRWDVLSDMYKEIVISNISSIDQEALVCNYEQAQCDQAIILQ